MDEKQRQLLLAVLETDSQIRASKQQSDEVRRQKVAAAQKEFKERSDNILKPGLDECFRMLREAGWQTNIQNIKNGFEVQVYRGDMRVYHTGVRPFVRFTVPDNFDEVSVNIGTPSSSGDGTPDDTAALENVTKEYVIDKVIALVNVLAMKKS